MKMRGKEMKLMMNDSTSERKLLAEEAMMMLKDLKIKQRREMSDIQSILGRNVSGLHSILERNMSGIQNILERSMIVIGRPRKNRGIKMKKRGIAETQENIVHPAMKTILIETETEREEDPPNGDTVAAAADHLVVGALDTTTETIEILTGDGQALTPITLSEEDGEISTIDSITGSTDMVVDVVEEEVVCMAEEDGVVSLIVSTIGAPMIGGIVHVLAHQNEADEGKQRIAHILLRSVLLNLSQKKKRRTKSQHQKKS